MKIELPKESVLINDNTATDMPEMPVVISNYSSGEGILLTGVDGESVYMSYRQVKEVCRQMLEYTKPKKKK